jgi:ABC-type lipopolysaccharide export system ATPase subunit
MEEQKVIYVEVPEGLYYLIKQQALFKHLSIKKYIIAAILEQMKKDAQFQ